MIRWFDVLGSTQDAAHAAAAEGASHGTAIAARVQTAGRGTRRREWVSSDGGLWLSVVCRPREIVYPEIMSLRVGLALAVLLDRWLFPDTHLLLKWPNDLFLGDRKAGGILTEARWQGAALQWLVVGVGLNLRNRPPEHTGTPATRLADHGLERSPEEIALPVVEAVSEAARAGAPLGPAELRAFEARDWLRGRRLLLPEEGVAQGIGGSGRLRIRRPDGAIVETLGTVELAGAAG